MANEATDHGSLSRVLDEAVAGASTAFEQGHVATYIPALARVPAHKLGVSGARMDGSVTGAGDHAEAFSIQSISKVFTLTLAMRAMAEDLWSRVGREPSGNPFNSLVQLEYERGRPRNPFINAGALVVADGMLSSYDHPKERLLEFVSELAGAPVEIDAEVARSEAETGFRNRAVAHLMKSFGNIVNDVDEVLDFYFSQCALRMSCDQLSTAARFLANRGIDPASRAEVVSPVQARRINSLLLTCGTYDAAGEIAFRIGLPCKSGVGGGIVAVVPDRLTLAVWSPALDSTGNSVAGRAVLERVTGVTGWSVF